MESNKQLTKTNKILIEQLGTSIKANNVLTKKLGGQKTSQAPAPAPSGGRAPFYRKAWEANLDSNGHCWTHGYRVQKGHTSADCKGKLGGHQKEATRKDNKGGSTKGKE
jgi:hypothetical protein